MWYEIPLAILLLVVGMVLLIKGADFFVEGASAVAKAMKIPSLVIGLTLVSVGTSMPEFSVSLQSSIKGLNDLSFGNVKGSNIFNVFVVIGVSAIFAPMVISKMMQKYDIPILLGVYLLLILFAFLITPNIIEVWEAAILFSITIIYTIFLILRSRNEMKNAPAEEGKKRKWWLNLIFIVLGVAGIIFGGGLVVDNASVLAKKLGMSDMLIGLTIVAVGTSLPELVTSVVAAKKGEKDIAIGNSIGSCLFNIVLILGFCSIITPAVVENSSIVDVIVMLISIVLLFLFTLRDKEVNRWQGVAMIIVYAFYLAFIILRNFYNF